MSRVLGRKQSKGFDDKDFDEYKKLCEKSVEVIYNTFQGRTIDGDDGIYMFTLQLNTLCSNLTARTIFGKTIWSSPCPLQGADVFARDFIKRLYVLNSRHTDSEVKLILLRDILFLQDGVTTDENKKYELKDLSSNDYGEHFSSFIRFVTSEATKTVCQNYLQTPKKTPVDIVTQSFVNLCEYYEFQSKQVNFAIEIMQAGMPPAVAEMLFDTHTGGKATLLQMYMGDFGLVPDSVTP